MHILLFGKNGQVGWELQRALAPLGHITAVDLTPPTIAVILAILQGWLKRYVSSSRM